MVRWTDRPIKLLWIWLGLDLQMGEELEGKDELNDHCCTEMGKTNASFERSARSGEHLQCFLNLLSPDRYSLPQFKSDQTGVSVSQLFMERTHSTGQGLQLRLIPAVWKTGFVVDDYAEAAKSEEFP